MISVSELSSLSQSSDDIDDELVIEVEESLEADGDLESGNVGTSETFMDGEVDPVTSKRPRPRFWKKRDGG